MFVEHKDNVRVWRTEDVGVPFLHHNSSTIWQCRTVNQQSQIP